MRSNSDMRVPPRMVLDVQKPGRLTRRDIGEYAGTYTRVQRF